MSSSDPAHGFVKDEDFVFSGDQIKDWFRLDRVVTRWSKKKYHKQGPQLWNDSAVPIDQQTVAAVAQDTYGTILKVDGFKEATAYYEWNHFWTVAYQQQWRADAIEGIKDFVESKSTGKAVKLLTELEEDKWPALRAIMMRKFAKTTPRQVKAMENEYIAGLPKSAGAAPFPKGIDIEMKLFDLEQHKLTLWLICPEERRDTYYHAKDATLVRIILNHVNSDYMPDLNRVIDLHKVERRRLGLAVPADAAAENYDDEWLPDYEVIKTCLEATYETLQKDSTVGKQSLPTMGMAEHGGRNGRKGQACWRCGAPGQRMGHEGCTNPTGIHQSAPAHAKQKHAEGILNTNHSPGSKPKPKGDKSTQACRFFKRGHCRFGEKCRFKHEGGGGGGNQVHQMSTAILQSMQQRLKAASKKNRGQQASTKKAKQESKKNIEICMCDMLLRFKYTATRAQPGPLGYHLGTYDQSSWGIFKDIALFYIFFTLREARFC